MGIYVPNLPLAFAWDNRVMTKTTRLLVNVFILKPSLSVCSQLCVCFISDVVICFAHMVGHIRSNLCDFMSNLYDYFSSCNAYINICINIKNSP